MTVQQSVTSVDKMVRIGIVRPRFELIDFLVPSVDQNGAERRRGDHLNGVFSVRILIVSDVPHVAEFRLRPTDPFAGWEMANSVA
jgi:hypothetical protein